MDRFNVGDLLAKVPLEEVVLRLGIETERRGSQTRALCPFHQDTKPSLSLFPADGNSSAHYHCFACGAHGNAIDLVKKIEGLDFVAAVRWLAQQFGIQSIRPQSSKWVEPKASSETARDFAIRVFDAHHAVPEFQNWCDDRAFDAKFLHSQGLRCILQGVLVEQLAEKSIGERAELIDGLLELGLIKRLRATANADQLKLNLQDQFQDFYNDGRVVIPIRDASLKRPAVVGFAGRALLAVPPEGVAKYLLTSGFEKAKHLFNASSAFAGVMSEVKGGKPSTLYVVEGFLDALRLHSLGQHAVALMGISIGKGQFELLQKLVGELPPSSTTLKLSVFLDNDPAGFGGTERLIRAFLGLPGLDLRWVGMPWRTQPTLGKDPDTCLQNVALPEEATAFLKRYDMPAEAVLVVAALGSLDATELQESRWNQVAASARERAVFRAALAVQKLHGRRLLDDMLARLQQSGSGWSHDLLRVLSGNGERASHPERSLYLEGNYERAALAQGLAYHGARRGELPCDEEVWLTLSGNAYLFDQTALSRLQAMMTGANSSWHQASSFDAVQLPRKLTDDPVVLDDPRLKVMPHPADLHLQQLLLNDLLTQRHDRLNASGQTFSACIPAVRWYASRREVVVTGPFTALNEPAPEFSEAATLSFGYQIDMDVLEGDKTPTDQGMFRPFGQCWREFMASLTKQCHAIGPRVHVLRLDAQRYYDSIQRYVVRDALIEPLRQAMNVVGVPDGLNALLGLASLADLDERDAALERLLCNLVFGYEYRDPERDGSTKRSDNAIGIPQGPVISAYIGTIALFPVDDEARQFMRRTARPGPDGMLIQRVGYARYVDDIVLFADSEDLLKELRETLQAKARERSITLIHKGDTVRSGSASQVMRQLNDGRGLAASVPAWDPPLMGDGEAGWGLGEDMPTVNRQCALQMLRHPALMADPKRIQSQVKAAMLALDFRPSDLGLCSRWLWWQVAAEGKEDPQERNGEKVWGRFWTLWESVCDGHGWAEAYRQRGYHWLYAVEGLDKLLDPNPWREHDQTLTELPKNRDKRQRLALVVCEPGFFDAVKPVENQSHILRRTRNVARKARTLARVSAANYNLEGQKGAGVTSIEWLCLAAERIGAVKVGGETLNTSPLASIKDRKIIPSAFDSGDEIARAVCEILQGRAVPEDKKNTGDNALGLAIDFVLNSAQSDCRLAVLSRFPQLLVQSVGDLEVRLIPHLPVVNAVATSIYAAEKITSENKRHLFRFAVLPRDDMRDISPDLQRSFLQVEFDIVSAKSGLAQVDFELKSHNNQLLVEQSKELLAWGDLIEKDKLYPITHRAARLFNLLLTMHRSLPPEGVTGAYVPFKPQLFESLTAESHALHLFAEPVRRDLLGVNAWFHDHDDRVRTVSVPKNHADLWRVGWAVADVIGVAADMGGETGHRDEKWVEDPNEGEDQGETLARHRALVENYVLRQQLRKLQGAFVSEALIDSSAEINTVLPSTVKRALTLLSSYPADKALDHQVRHLLLVEAETRSMALRLAMRSSDDMRKVLHQVFPEVLARLPLWALQGLHLTHATANSAALRPEVGLVLTLYRALDHFEESAFSDAVDSRAAPWRMALVLTAVGIGLRGSVAALWGLSAQQGSHRMADRFNLPPTWSMPDMTRLDPQRDYSAMRKWLYEADWPALSRASPWHWMLALIGLLDASFSQAFKVAELKDVYLALSSWQSEPVGSEEGTQPDDAWPFDALPKFSKQRADEVIDILPVALQKLDKVLGLRIIQQKAQQFRRSLHSDEFTDAKDASWQITKIQFTSLGHEGVERWLEGSRWLLVWSETRRIIDNELLAVHTLDFKLGQWKQQSENEPSNVNQQVGFPEQGPAKAELFIQGPAITPDQNNEYTRKSTVAGRLSDNADNLAPIPAPPKVPEPGGIIEPELMAAALHTSHSDLSTLENVAGVSLGEDVIALAGASTFAGVERFVDNLRSSQMRSLEARRDIQSGGHFRVALFQWRVEDSYAHPISEVGLNKLPLDKNSAEELRGFLKSGSIQNAQRAAKRGAEHLWAEGGKVISWPESRRRVLLTEALKACNALGVQLLVLPEVSVRPETVSWLKVELKRYPDLAVLAGTYRGFNKFDHLTENLTLLWQPDKKITEAFGLENDNLVLQFHRGKKYRAVAANEFFRPDLSPLLPLYNEEQLFRKLLKIRSQKLKGELSSTQLIAAVTEIDERTPKLRYCMELICSELFLLTSPANHKPLWRELAKLTKLFGLDPNPSEETAKKCVMHDYEALGECLTVVQSRRERRSVLLVPACTTRSNDYWHAGQASVLASGTATIFCNAATRGSAGGSCFIGIDSVTPTHDLTGIVRALTPYHGWQKGILQPTGQGALSKDDQALVVIDLDPVHVVSGKPRPQLLPEPMSLVAYLPIVEVVDKHENAEGIAKALGHELKYGAHESVKSLLLSGAFPAHCGQLHERRTFFQAYQTLVDANKNDSFGATGGTVPIDAFAAFFGEPEAVRQRLVTWLEDSHQQPGMKAGALRLEPAWLDFLVADLTCDGDLPLLEVPPWLEEPSV